MGRSRREIREPRIWLRALWSCSESLGGHIYDSELDLRDADLDPHGAEPAQYVAELGRCVTEPGPEVRIKIRMTRSQFPEARQSPKLPTPRTA